MNRDQIIKILEAKGYQVTEESHTPFTPIQLLWVIESTGKKARLNEHKAFSGRSGRNLGWPSDIKPRSGWDEAVALLQELLTDMDLE